MSYFQPHNHPRQASFRSTLPADFPSPTRQSQPLGHKSPPDRLDSFSGRGFVAEEHALPASSAPQIEPQCRMVEDYNGLGGFLPRPFPQRIHGQVTDFPTLFLHEPDQCLFSLISPSIVSFEKKMAIYRRYTNVAPSSHLSESPLSASTISNPAGTPRHVGRQVREDKLPETTPASRTVSSSGAFEAITIESHAPAFTLAPAPAIPATGVDLSWTTSRTRSESSPVVFALGISSTSDTLDKEVTSSRRLASITAESVSTAHASTISPSFSSTASKSAPAQTATASPVHIQSVRTTGIIIGSVLGGLAMILMASLAIFYITWRRRRRRRQDQVDREKGPTQQRSNDAAGGTGNTTEERKRSTESPMTLPLQGAAANRTLRSQPIIVDTISPVTPILPHLSRWTSEKADIPSPHGHPAINIPPHLRHHPLFASTHYSHDDDEDGGDEDLRHPGSDVSPCSSSSPSPSPSPRPPGLPSPAADENTALSGFLFFDSPSSRSSTRRPSTRDSSAPRTALSMPPPHRPPPRRRHTRAGGQGRGGGIGGGIGGGATRSRRGSGSSVCGGGFGEANSATPPSPPPPLPVRNAARSKSLHNVERSAVWI